jgi:hypothetical protein
MSPDEIDRITPAQHLTSVFFGYISGMPDADFLRYVSRFRDHSMVRHVFFSDVQKRLELPSEIVDEVTEELLAALEDGKDRAKNETFIKYLLPHMSKQMRTRTFRTVLRIGTKTMRNKLLRRLTPQDAPGIATEILNIALNENDEHALVGIVYRWPLSAWKEHAEALFKAAGGLPWLQRQIVFRSDKSNMFLDRRLIEDPVTELYVRARYRREASLDLIDAAIKAATSERDTFEFSDRVGLVAWCLGRFSMFDKLKDLGLGDQGCRVVLLPPPD